MDFGTPVLKEFEEVAMRAMLACVLLLVAVAFPSAAGTKLPPTRLADHISLKIAGLKVAFAHDSAGMGASTAESAVTQKLKHFEQTNGEEIARVLAYARKSETQRDLLADFLLADLDRFSRQFGPGAKIDEELLTKRQWGLEEMPSHGVTVDSLLLFTLVEERAQPALTGRVLEAVARAAEADSNFYLQGVAQRERPGRSEQSPPVFTEGPTGRELSWLCDQFLVNAHRNHTFTQPAAKKILAEYLQKGGDRKFISDRTMEHAQRLAKALAPPATAGK